MLKTALAAFLQLNTLISNSTADFSHKLQQKIKTKHDFERKIIYLINADNQ